MSKEQSPVITWKTRSFNELSLLELHEIFRIRLDIFIVEQDCPYSEIDGRDSECIHIIGSLKEGDIIATARIAPAGVIYPDWSIGRVAVREEYRHQGIGKKLMQVCLDYCQDKGPIKIAAQCYLEKFYNHLGFETMSEVYLWDGIEHIDMIFNGSDQNN